MALPTSSPAPKFTAAVWGKGPLGQAAMCPGPCGWVTVKLSAAPAAVVGTPQSVPPVVTPPIWMVLGMFAWRGVPVTRVSSARQGVASGMNSGPLWGCAAAEVARLSVRASRSVRDTQSDAISALPLKVIGRNRDTDAARSARVAGGRCVRDDRDDAVGGRGRCSRGALRDSPLPILRLGHMIECAPIQFRLLGTNTIV